MPDGKKDDYSLSLKLHHELEKPGNSALRREAASRERWRKMRGTTDAKPAKKGTRGTFVLNTEPKPYEAGPVRRYYFS